MQIKIRKKKVINALESGSLSDLAFLLIIFFIVIAVFNVNMGFLLDLPKKNSSKIVNTQDIIRVAIEADAQITCDEETVTIEKLQDLVTERLKLRPNMTLYLLIDPEVEYQAVVDIIDVIRLMKVENFSFKMKGT
ncbi:MAG: hypothetical protein A2015_04310 [Spirochaetes bacterium GWF1_31_7]|nr:MAG: hypothetical protein A2Y30_16960 [Spirochaetes bacterium GWE1_32_154]OHD47389.1 MAG: hypothetical protein A2Y29_09970 [Spirochaetes bacterium GWE2_31_10]OHD52944.1 MAG: hypothetical protein A2015_04310 [Spirochaetes bacterium GWF1_31_7]OHD81421.1 MAG: hypothetical protein A2355_09535 [Spirochaetes bacterium RIFOXYB1_FULL_32_8]HBD93687.1 hypothetical protein [Spirochaetia bacterium]